MDNRIVIRKYRYTGQKRTWKKKVVYRYIMKCLHCKRHFEILARDYNRGRGQYCSHECSQQRMCGKGNPRWKGGKRDGYGYVLIHKSLVPKQYHYLARDGGFYVREHRLVIAKKLERKLKTKELVHHLNGIRDDNRSENLAIVDANNHEHFTLRKRLQIRIRELEAEITKLQ